MRPPLEISIRPSASLTKVELEEIWALTERYFDTPRDRYEQKLLALPEVGLWRVRGGELAGLVGLDVYPVVWQGRTRVIIFTASVVADERFRGRNLVLRTGLRLLAREKLRRPFAPVYWLFDTYSYKSYLILARNFREFWPRRARLMPPEVTAFLDCLASQRYGASWNKESGIARSSGLKQLRAHTAPIDQPLRSDPDIRFFEEKNPGHRSGDMLICMAPLTARNLLGAMKRALGFKAAL